MKKYIKKYFSLHVCFFAICLLALNGCKDDEVEVSPGGGATVNKTVEEINSNLRALQKLIAAKVENKEVKICTQISNSTYQVELADGNSFNFLTHVTTLGETEGPAYSPVVSAIQNGDIYYWALDGNLLTSSNENIKVVDGEVPTISIDNEGYWTVTCGETVEKLSRKVENGTVKSLFGGVDQTNVKEVKFYLRGNIPSLSLARTKSGENPGIDPTYTLRRPISPDHPAWLVHIDTWNLADPQKIIDLIPEDIRPYVIFNISLSQGRDDTGRFKLAEYGYEIAKSWLRTCAENNVWAMVQPASGGFCHFPDFSTYEQLQGSLYEEFFKEYPNFLGFNYCEQFWGFDDPLSVSWSQRVAHWTQLLKLTNAYGGYLVVSFCSLASDINPIALVKRNPDFAQSAKSYTENFIMCEKYTSQSCFFNTESICLGTWLSGFAGQYGIRFDECGWTHNVGQNGDMEFPHAAGAIPIIEHVMLTGQTVIDGPELIWAQCFKETNAVSGSGGYKSRNWECYPQFLNINIDMFRKIIDGTIRIPSRQEVIDRSQLILLQDVYSGDNNAQYSAPKNLHEGLYLRDDDGNREDNHCYFKKTGRYPTIPVAFELCDDVANSFQYKINQSTYDGTWSSLPLKIGKFNRMFPEEYTGELYAGRIENGWVIYNGLVGTRNATIPFKYNTCDRMELAYSKYTISVMKEYADKLSFYMNNYDVNGSNKTEMIKIFGCISKPTYSVYSRANGNADVSESFEDGIYTLNIKHNGPLDLTVNCSGNSMDRETGYTSASVSIPASPETYQGAHQYEGECFDYKDVAKVVTLGYDDPIRYFTGQGYINFGFNSTAAVRDDITVVEDGTYTIRIRYRSPSATINTVDMYVNNIKVDTLEFLQTADDNGAWDTITLPASLKKGTNTFELKANSQGAGDLYIDNIIIERN